MARKTFEQKLNSPFFKYSKRLFDIVSLNIIFIIVSVLSCLVLFFPCLISLHTIAYNFVHDNDEPVYKTFFVEIKKQWSFGWRMTLLGLGSILILGTLIYFDIYYINHYVYNWIGWVTIVFLVTVSMVMLILIINLMLFNDYFKDDTFKMMIKKAAVIGLRKKLLSFFNLIILIALGVVLFIAPYIIPFISFSVYVYILQAINKKSFDEIAREEMERMLKPENLFLPIVMEDLTINKSSGK